MMVAMDLEGKKIVMLVSGGIAAYKAADLASRLKKSGAEVRVAMTRSAQEFIAPLTFEAICGQPVYHRLFGQSEAYRMEHIEWARWADVLIAAPATADFLARMAQGRADDAPSTLYLAFDGPVWAAPAMKIIDAGIGVVGGFVAGLLPAGLFNDLLVHGVIDGVGGVEMRQHVERAQGFFLARRMEQPFDEGFVETHFVGVDSQSPIGDARHFAPFAVLGK